jgi:hypothetical protein
MSILNWTGTSSAEHGPLHLLCPRVKSGRERVSRRDDYVVTMVRRNTSTITSGSDTAIVQFPVSRKVMLMWCFHKKQYQFYQHQDLGDLGRVLC